MEWIVPDRLAMLSPLSRRAWAVQCLAWGPLGRTLLRSQESNPPRVDESLARIAPGSLDGVQGTITPASQFFLRNHHREPDLTMAEWKLSIEGKVARPQQLTFSDLLESPPARIEAVLECAGNDAGSGVLVGNGLWEGVSLSHFLKLAAPSPDVNRILLVGADRGSLLEGVSPYPYARIIPLDQGLAPEVLIAFRLNNQFLPRRHGFPARALLPGQYAMNSVKWLERIVALGPGDRPDEFYASGMDLLYRRTFHKASPNAPSRVSQILVKSGIVTPAAKARLAAGAHTISGFAWAGRNRVVSVNVSVDGAKTWRPAKLEGVSQPFRWVRWSFIWEASPGEHLLASCAQDSAGNRQPPARDPDRRDGYELNWSAPVSCSVK
jgi:DMSO/TMAO reductase YedYZ molybdopterin-dependent catalytic subunit